MNFGILATTALLPIVGVATPARAEVTHFLKEKHSADCNDRYREQNYSNRDWDDHSRRDRADIYDDIDKIYQEVLGRDADRDGLRTYQRRLVDGWSLNRVHRDIAKSKEARDRRR